MIDYKGRYENLCIKIREQSRELRRAFNTDDCTKCPYGEKREAI